MGIDYLQVDVTNAEDFEKLPKEDVFAIVNLVGLLPAYIKYLEECKIEQELKRFDDLWLNNK